jgi:hypothetical protein
MGQKQVSLWENYRCSILDQEETSNIVWPPHCRDKLLFSGDTVACALIWISNILSHVWVWMNSPWHSDICVMNLTHASVYVLNLVNRWPGGSALFSKSSWCERPLLRASTFVLVLFQLSLHSSALTSDAPCRVRHSALAHTYSVSVLEAEQSRA